MKPAPFDYALASSIDEAVNLLADTDGETIVLAGGQTLLPMLSMRLARPDRVVDINGVAELAGIEDAGAEIIVKACTRQAAALASPVIRDKLPLLSKAIGHVGHTQTRNRGTLGGSLAHADPAAEIPLAALSLDAEVTLRSVSGSRRLKVADYFVGPMMTAREPDELLVSLHFPLRADAAVGTGFHEIAERHGDFAVVAVAAQLGFDTGGTCTHAAVAFGGVDAHPVRIAALEAALVKSDLGSIAVAAALDCITDGIEPTTDQHASADYRRRVARHLAARAIADAAQEARGGAA